MTDYNGTTGPDTIVGSEGADTINGNGGGDLLLGDMGNDYLVGGTGLNSIYGGMGSDTIVGGPGNGFLRGDMGNDFVYGGKGNDTLYGGKGDDFLFGGQGTNVIHGDIGNDTAGFAGNRADYTISQNADGSYLIQGDGSVDTVYTVENFQFKDQTDTTANLIPPPGSGSGGGGGAPALPTPAAGTVDLDQGGKVVGTFTTIQAAVNAETANGEVVDVGAGTFQEQVTDNTGFTSTLEGQGEGKTTIESPDAANLVANETATDSARPDKFALIGVGNNSTLNIDKLTINGEDQGAINDANGYDFVGIDGTNTTVNTNGVDITGIQETPNADGSPSGNQRNTAIILDDNDGVARTDNINSTSVENFQKNGIASYGTGLTTNEAQDIITGAGDISSTAQNGTEFLKGATGSVTGSTFSSIGYTGGGTTATDILTEGATSSFTVANNLITGGAAAMAAGGNLGVYLQGTDGGSITGNQFTNLAQGIDDEPGAGQANAMISGNTYKNVTTPSNV